jgi:uncharacterized protein YeaO (DUF488 family)
MIKTRRVYEPAGESDGARFLVDRLWPRGKKREDLALAAWIPEAAPSNELRHWYAHDPEKWPEFRERYAAELEANPEAWQPIVQAAHQGNVTLLYSSRELELNNAVALKLFVEHQMAPAT